MESILTDAKKLHERLTDALASGQLHYNIHPLDLVDLAENLKGAQECVPKLQDIIPQPTN